MKIFWETKWLTTESDICLRSIIKLKKRKHQYPVERSRNQSLFLTYTKLWDHSMLGSFSQNCIGIWYILSRGATGDFQWGGVRPHWMGVWGRTFLKIKCETGHLRVLKSRTPPVSSKSPERLCMGNRSTPRPVAPIGSLKVEGKLRLYFSSQCENLVKLEVTVILLSDGKVPGKTTRR